METTLETTQAQAPAATPPLPEVFVPPSYLWGTNPWPAQAQPDSILQLGCGEHVIDEFINVDFIPHDQRVMEWDLLDFWPQEMEGKLSAIYSEDVLEHFFYTEQLYILCSANLSLKTGGVCRVLMPNVDGLAAGLHAPSAQSLEFYSKTMGLSTGADILNAGMRFSGHRWLHNQVSFADMAARCGFQANRMPCSQSVVPGLCNRNLRNETNSLSFANDLVKTRSMRRFIAPPAAVVDCEEVGRARGLKVFRTLTGDPQVYYRFAQPVPAGSIVLVNIRCSNLSAYREHSIAQIFFQLNEEGSCILDETLKSKACMNAVHGGLAVNKMPPGYMLNAIRFDPTARAGDHIVLGPLEVFYLE